MAWKKGQSGNPSGRKINPANRLLTNAFKAALEVDQTGNGNRKFDRLIAAILKDALSEDSDKRVECRKLILDRLQAPLRHEMTEDEVDQLGGLFDLLQLTRGGRPEDPDELDAAAE